MNRTTQAGQTILALALSLGAVALLAQNATQTATQTATQNATQKPTDTTGQTTAHVTDEPVTNSTNLVYPVAFELGETHLLPGDAIHIDSVTGSAPTIQPGNVYLVTGTYKLASHPAAQLSTNTTTTASIGSTQNHDPRSQPRATQVKQGEGAFKVYLHVAYDGYPHLSFYPASGGESFASVYFGTGDTTMKPHPHNTGQ